jgi:hypothetical protein
LSVEISGHQNAERAGPAASIPVPNFGSVLVLMPEPTMST